MRRRAVLLSGEHPSLPAAELRALLDVHAPTSRLRVDGLIATVEPLEGQDERAGQDGQDGTARSGWLAGVDAALGRLVLAHEWGEPWGHAPDDDAGLEALAEAVRHRAAHLGPGSAAVASIRRGRTKSPNSMRVERTLGSILQETGHAIDLRSPRHILYAWLLEGQIHTGLHLGAAGRSAFEGRATDRRAHFSPVSLHPRRAASLLHLARVAPGGTIYDPFCGTGGFVLEAALEGYRVLASDIDPFMAQGTLQTITDVPVEPLDADVFVADIGRAPELAGPVDGIVTDLPYGRASGTDREALASLYGRALAAFAALLRPDGHAVVGHPDPKLLEELGRHGLALVESHAEYTHKSLTRHFAVIKRLQGVEGQ